MKNVLTIICLSLTSATTGAQSPALAQTQAKSPSRDVASSGTTDSYPGHWNQWRGPQRSGHVPATTWPKRLNKTNLQQAWRIPLGPSYSGPVVSDELVFTTSTENKKTEVVTAFQRSTGKVVWRTEWAGSMTVPFFAGRNGSWIRSTPAFDGESLFVAGMRDVLVSLDAKTGKERWRVDFVKRFKSNGESFGFVCSPIVDDDSVYVQTGAGVVKLDKKSGATKWLTLKDKGGMFGGAFSSPIRTKLAGRDHLLVQSRTALSGVDPASGAVLWSADVKSFRGMNILTPLPHGNSVFTSAYGGRGHRFTVSDTDGKLAVDRKWTNRVQAYMSSPVAVDGHAYVYLRSRRLCCMHLDSGELKWTSPPISDEYWSLVANGDRILALSESGELLLIAANPERFEIVDRMNVVESETWAHLAVDGNQILIRALDGLIAFTWNQASASRK
jgi:outer membrane protein assembly factor BamB